MDEESATAEESSAPDSDNALVESNHQMSLLNQDDSDCTRPGSAKLSAKEQAKTPPTLRYFSGNPAVEMSEGILHLYKEK